MNIYAVIILTALFLDYILDLVSNSLNLKALDPELPDEFSEVFDSEKYRKSQEYTRVRTRFGLLTGTFDLAVILLFWFFGGFGKLDSLVRGWELHEIFNGLVFIGILMVMRFIISQPFSIYSTFVIEERFGFNRTTPATYIKDLLKGLLLGILLGGPLLAGIIAFFLYAGDNAWWYCWIAAVLFTLVIQYIAPTWIMPLFNKFTPLEEGELKDTILKYTEKVRFSLKGLFVIDGSKRSSKSNAFFTGFGKNKRIALFDTLIERHTIDELVAVLAHEIGHYKKKHIIKGMAVSIVYMGAMFYLLSIFLTHEGLFSAFYVEVPSVYTGFIFFGMLFAPIEMILSIFMHIYSRKNEFEADRFAAETTETSQPMVSALKKLSANNLSNLTPHPFYVFLNYSHPPVLTRIRTLESLKI